MKQLYRCDQHRHRMWNYLGGLWFMVFNATFNNISVISWRSVLLVEETEEHGENDRPVASH
jgi:hypothetical protein